MLTEQLVLNPHSRVFAIRGGTPELQGWDAATVMAARTHNLIAQLIAGLGGDSVDIKDLLIEYPGRKEAEPIPVASTLSDFIERFVDNGAMTEFMYGKG